MLYQCYGVKDKRVLKDFGLSESTINAAIIGDLYIAQIVATLRKQSNCADGLHKLKDKGSLNKKAYIGRNFQ